MTQKRRKTRPVTAAELMARLEADPAWVAKRDAREAERKRQEALLAAAEVPLLEELRSAGYGVDSVWSLVNSSESYPEALPVLLRHLGFAYPDRVREGIARALAVPGSVVLLDVLVAKFVSELSEEVKDGLACAIAAAADAEHMDEVIDLIVDPSHGPSRVLLLRALERATREQAHATLERAARDPDMRLEALDLRKRLESRASPLGDGRVVRERGRRGSR